MLPKAKVKMAGEVYVPENYNIEVNISRLDGTWEDVATLEGWWQITDKNGKQLTSSRTYLTTPLGGENYVALVEAESALIAGLSQEISSAFYGSETITDVWLALQKFDRFVNGESTPAKDGFSEERDQTTRLREISRYLSGKGCLCIE